LGLASLVTSDLWQPRRRRRPLLDGVAGLSLCCRWGRSGAGGSTIRLTRARSPLFTGISVASAIPIHKTRRKHYPSCFFSSLPTSTRISGFVEPGVGACFTAFSWSVSADACSLGRPVEPAPRPHGPTEPVFSILSPSRPTDELADDMPRSGRADRSRRSSGRRAGRGPPRGSGPPL
jgi:hypothetical protein